MSQISEVGKIRREVLIEISRLIFEGKLEQEIYTILGTVVKEDGPRYRCCVHKERAVLGERINMALSQPIGTRLEDAAENTMNGKFTVMPIINVLPEACDRCPIDKFLVTDACRNCIAHSCISSCPKNAIMVVQNRAYIDKTKCVECGLCKRSCQYGAIIEISRPCERVCELEAITAGNDRRAVVDYTKCVSCGACMIACPFGAINEYSQIGELAVLLKAQKKRIYAMLAPSYSGQFGPKVKSEQVAAGLRKLGFAETVEVAFAADVVTNAEAKEFVETIMNGQDYMTTSCCPAFVTLAKQFPDALSHVSTTVSPMIAAGKIIKADEPEAVVVFIGPCVAKKAEAVNNREIIDFAITFEELSALFIGAGIDLQAGDEVPIVSGASSDGIGFAKAGGVAQAVKNVLSTNYPGMVLKEHHCDGLANCKSTLTELAKGTLAANFLEGMACPGGCVGGPGRLMDARVTAKMVEQHSAKAAIKSAAANKAALDEGQKHFSDNHN
ncbi:MAG: hydrogenase large subunit domain protein [Firmicutes bacterium]|nr:hydrogenase large subunit domain protein [Bacillota bacterium]